MEAAIWKQKVMIPIWVIESWYRCWRVGYMAGITACNRSLHKCAIAMATRML